MKIRDIYYGSVFEKQFLNLPEKIKQKAIKAESVFRNNPFHPSLRLHKLHGKLKDLWSISLNKKYRIVFSVEGDGEILFLSIGSHEIYE